MTPWEQAKAFYYEHGLSLLDDLRRHFKDGYVISTPTVFAMGYPKAVYSDKLDTWFITFAAGKLEDFFSHLPFWLDYVCYERNGIVKAHTMTALANKILSHDSFQDGPVNSLSWRWWRWQDQTASTANTVHCRRECGQATDSGQAA